jgi:hypothetical protein
MMAVAFIIHTNVKHNIIIIGQTFGFIDLIVIHVLYILFIVLVISIISFFS